MCDWRGCRIDCRGAHSDEAARLGKGKDRFPYLFLYLEKNSISRTFFSLWMDVLLVSEAQSA